MEASVSFNKVSRTISPDLTLNNLNFGVEKGSLHALAGTDHTLLRETLLLAAAVIFPHHGSVYIGGVPTVKQPAEIKKITAFVSAKSFISNRISFRKNCHFMMKMYGKNPANAEPSTRELAMRFKMEKYLDIPSEKIPSDFRFLLSLIQSNLYNPEIILMDLPFNDTPPEYHALLEEYLMDMRRIKTILYSCSQAQHIEDIPDRITILHNGSILFNGTYLKLKEALQQQIILKIRLKKNSLKYYRHLVKTFPLLSIRKQRNTLFFSAMEGHEVQNILTEINKEDVLEFSTNSHSLTRIIRRLTVDDE